MSETLNIQGFNTTKKLHTDVLEELYGTISAQVIRHDGPESFVLGKNRIRVARLVDKDNICRTYAVTFLTYDKNNQQIAEIDAKIKDGGSIGKVFRSYGYEIKKNVLDVFVFEVPRNLQEDLRTNIANFNNQAKVRLSEFYAKNEGGTPLIYGFVIEIYPPDFREPTISAKDLDQINPTTSTLLDLGVPVDEIRHHLDYAGDRSQWGDYGELYSVAIQRSKPIVESIRNRFIDYLYGN